MKCVALLAILGAAAIACAVRLKEGGEGDRIGRLRFRMEVDAQPQSPAPLCSSTQSPYILRTNWNRPKYLMGHFDSGWLWLRDCLHGGTGWL